MPESRMIGLLPETKISGVTASFKICGDAMPDDYFEKLVAAGQIHSTVIEFEKKPLYRVLWETRKDGAEFHILFLQELIAGGDNIAVAFVGCRKLAASLGCLDIAFETARRGMVEQAKKFGAMVYAVAVKIPVYA